VQKLNSTQKFQAIAEKKQQIILGDYFFAAPDIMGIRRSLYRPAGGQTDLYILTSHAGSKPMRCAERVTHLLPAAFIFSAL